MLPPHDDPASFDPSYSYTPLDEADKQTFTVGLKTKMTLESIILHYRARGLCIDSSWRNKNENRAAVTNITAINEAFHFTPGMWMLLPLQSVVVHTSFSAPGASFISASTNEATMERMLRTLSHEIVERATELCEGKQPGVEVMSGF